MLYFKIPHLVFFLTFGVLGTIIDKKLSILTVYSGSILLASQIATFNPTSPKLTMDRSGFIVGQIHYANLVYIELNIAKKVVDIAL